MIKHLPTFLSHTPTKKHSTKQHANSSEDNELSGHGFTQIGEFQYEKDLSKDRMQVYKVSSELGKLRAFTSSIVIKAVSNYGAPDHTCFYRVKMYGEKGGIENTEDVVEEESTL